jgi:radical SAM superfamily enzyme YgiQ (UPF0313 family)
MKVALVRSRPTYANWYKYPALGIAYISSYLESKGFETHIFDAYFHGWSDDELIRTIIDYRPDCVGFTAMTHEIVHTAQIANRCKELLPIPFIIGGCHFTALPRRTMEEFPVFDYGIFGEGELTMAQVCQELEKNGPHDFSGLQGLVYRDNERVVINDARPFLTGKQLDELPYPAYHHYYGTANPRALSRRNDQYVMFTSRGCPAKCTFCMRVLGKRVRRRSKVNICDEIVHAADEYGAHSINFADDVFLFNNRETFGIIDEIIERRLNKKITWGGQIRANHVTRELVTRARESGCVYLAMGVESGDDEVLKKINKGITVQQVREAVNIIKDAGIYLGTYYILGHPDETLETARKTVDLAVSLNTNQIAVGIMAPYPGTHIYELAKNGEGGYCLLTENWEKYDKYFGNALGFKNVSYKELLKLQKHALLWLYIRNGRFIDLFSAMWRRRAGLWYAIKKIIAR